MRLNHSERPLEATRQRGHLNIREWAAQHLEYFQCDGLGVWIKQILQRLADRAHDRGHAKSSNRLLEGRHDKRNVGATRAHLLHGWLRLHDIWVGRV